MKILYILLLFAISAVQISSQIYSPYIPVMTSGAPMPVGVRYPGAAGYSFNDSAWMYVLGGLQDGNVITNTVYRYSVLENSWSTIANFPDGSFWISAAAVVGKKLYSMGGTYTLALNECTPRVKILNLISNTWSDGANMPYGRVFHSLTAYQDSLIYCAGGWGFPSGTVYNDVYLYNANTNTWRTATGMPAPRCGGVLAAAGDTLVYVCGGPNWTNPSATNTVFRGVVSQSDRSVITWDSTGAVYPGGVRNSIYGASWGQKGIIVSGGYQVSSVTSQCYVYSPGANVWTPQPSLTAPKTDHGAASVNIGNIWKFISATGTSNRSGSNSNTVNILTDTMTTITGIASNGNSIPNGFDLKQNYPNPFNPETSIDFSVVSSSSGKVYTSVIIYDVMGREVEKLFIGELSAGNYSLQWNAADEPSGTYFARLTAVDYNKTIKLILSK